MRDAEEGLIHCTCYPWTDWLYRKEDAGDRSRFHRFECIGPFQLETTFKPRRLFTLILYLSMPGLATFGVVI
jgi:hypothetical protein